jgi:alcohol dehydrogenase class IV
MREPEVWPLTRLLAENLGPAIVWATPSVRARTESVLPYSHGAPEMELPAPTRTLIAVGGGTLIDAAKVFRRECAPALRLIAVPSIWGSGAEASPVAIVQDGVRKRIRVGSEYIPDVRVEWPELADSAPERLVRNACGDAWSHAIEALLSPLADEDLRGEIATLISRMLGIPLGRDVRWFEASVAACRFQARSSVGLVHGIAHTLEGPLRAEQPEFPWGHAALCSTFLWPVMALNLRLSSRAQEWLSRAGLVPDQVLAVARALFDEESYAFALPLLESHWKEVLRDPCTRTNGALIRPAALDFFQRRAFAA